MVPQMLLFLGLFIGELFLLSLLSKSLNNSLFKFFYWLTKSKGSTVNIFAILFLPGTIIHELSHMLVAGILFVPVGEIDVVPQVTENGVRLGSAQIGETDLLRRTIVGVAPAIVGLFIIMSILFLTREGMFVLDRWWEVVGVVYVIFQIANTMFSSKKDLEGAAIFLGTILTLLFLAIIALYFFNYLTNVWNFLNSMNLSRAIAFLQKVETFLLIPLGINLTCVTLAKIFSFAKH